jgi:hypothetical protein
MPFLLLGLLLDPESEAVGRCIGSHDDPSTRAHGAPRKSGQSRATFHFQASFSLFKLPDTLSWGPSACYPSSRVLNHSFHHPF